MIVNMAASVAERLRNLALNKGTDFGQLLNRYGRERLLYRLSRSKHHDRFVLKGAALIEVWTGGEYRPTRDVDFLGYGGSSVADLVGAFRDVCETEVEDDGLKFVADSVKGEEIRDAQEYPGVRLRMLAKLANAHIDLQVDVGFGDAVNPGVTDLVYPVLLDFEAPRIRAYPRETVVAEKYEALVRYGMANSRMKDFYDILVLARGFDFDAETLSVAIKRTFDRRASKLPTEVPLGLSADFARDSAKAKQWNAFLQRIGEVESMPDLPTVIADVRAFLWPPAEAASKSIVSKVAWKAGGPWK